MALEFDQNATDRRTELFRRAGAERILVLDGAMGTSIQALDLGPDDFGGPDLEGCNEILNVVKPEAILGIHRSFLEAGADIVETNTFGSTPLVLAEYGLGDRAREISRAAARLARQAAAEFDTPDRTRFVAGSMGPTTKSISVTGGVTFDEMVGHYREQAIGLLEGGVDYLLIETSQDTLNVKAGILGIQEAFQETGRRVPIAASCTIEAMGTMLAGQGVDAFYTSVEHTDLLAVGLNCATGPAFMTDHLRTLAGLSQTWVACVPNAGLPDETGCYNETPEKIATVLGRFAEQGWLNMVGGCCGTTPAHIAAIAHAVKGKAPRRTRPERFSRVSGIDFLSLEEENRPLIVGERTNVIGSRKFKDLIHAGKYEEAAEVGRNQVRGGAHILDVCLADPDRNEDEDMHAFLDRVTRKVKVPIMLDSTDAAVLDRALRQCQGKSIINSVNLEDGEERFERVVPLARRFGAALIVGCIDEDPVQGMAVTRDRKLAIAQRSHDLLTTKYGIAAQDLIFDPLVFPCATGDANYVGSAGETIEGVRLIKQAFPSSKTILGISNVSFGLPAKGREVLNSVFLHHCVAAGLDLAIVNSERLERYASIPEEERNLAEDLLLNRGTDPIGAFAAFYRDRAPVRTPTKQAAKSLEERLAGYIVEGSRDGLVEDLELALAKSAPLDIINGPLMTGMDEVGRLFNRNELIVAEVLQSAEAMKAAVTHLEPLMEKSGAAARGKLLLATVKGDVHDIGKNLVEIVVGNNGYEVVNLGIKVPPGELIAAVERHRPDLIGLSGLLVKSAQQMVVTAQDFEAAGLKLPILVGGAALTKKFTETRIAPEYAAPVIYCRDAMDGLEVVQKLLDPKRKDDLLASRWHRGEAPAPTKTVAAPAVLPRWRQVPVPEPPDLRHHVVDGVSLAEVFAYVNPQMLYAKHLGLRGSIERLRERGDEKTARLEETIEALQKEVLAMGIMRPRAVYRFFAASTEGDTIVLRERPGGTVLARLTFPRQPDRDRLSLSDWVAPATDARTDYLGAFVTTCGEGVRAQAEVWKSAGEYLKSYALQALAIEAAEGFAELLHQRMRKMWGFPDAPNLTRKELFQAKYRGIRVSFGYPACPELEDQAVLWRLLEPDRHIGVALTEGFMMDPEASVSALVFHHPDARYFSIGSAEEPAPVEEKSV
jgi:5-methyltetrahydrofolate--homocysteine methyltransferase